MISVFGVDKKTALNGFHADNMEGLEIERWDRTQHKLE